MERLLPSAAEDQTIFPGRRVRRQMMVLEIGDENLRNRNDPAARIRLRRAEHEPPRRQLLELLNDPHCSV